MVAPGVASVNETEIEPANPPPSGVIAGALTVVFFELVVVVLAVESVVVFERVPAADAVAVAVVEAGAIVAVLVTKLNPWGWAKR